MTPEQSLRNIFSKDLKFTDAACDWLCDIFALIQLFDDVADGDEVDRKDLDRVLWASLVGMSCNSFWVQHAEWLRPILALQIIKWQGSDNAERKGKADEKSFVWRAGYYDLVAIVYALIHGKEAAAKDADIIMNLYGEKYEDYKKGFDNA